MDTAEAAFRLVDIEWEATKAREAYEALEDSAMRYHLRNVIANARLIIEWANEVDKVNI